MTRENFDIAAFAKEVHDNAREHGWWDDERSETEVRALIHSEWSEALEEARAGRPLVWHDKNGKPEGVAVELMDGCIRILDWFGEKDAVWENGVTQERIEELSREGISIKPNLGLGIADPLEKTLETFNTAEIVDALHEVTVRYFDVLVFAYGIACAWVRAQGLDPVELLIEKHEYNKSRPYKHGKKF